MQYSIFNNKRIVNIDNNLLKVYEKYVATICPLRVEHFVLTSGANENTDDLDSVVNDAIVEELSMYAKTPELIKAYRIVN